MLEIANPSDAIKSLDADERMTLDNSEGHSGQRGGAQSLNLISESGLYALVFKSRKPQAHVGNGKWVSKFPMVPSHPGALTADGSRAGPPPGAVGNGNLFKRSLVRK
ncbi:Bro-N domain-containing protein [Verrucomicrobium sp. BvORR034]|uniref:BRO family protein n=1 Tax=Verrucomicrobium sp. BvORR034 TaxID=1396418 RepID=UPI0009DEC190